MVSSQWSVSTETHPIEEEEVAGEVNESVNAVAISVEDQESVTDVTGAGDINAGEKWPKCWTEQQVKDFTNKYSWLYSKNNCLGCTTCRAAKLDPGLVMQGMSFPMQWCDATVQIYGDGRPAQLKPLRKKLLCTKKTKFISYFRKFS